MGVPGPLDNLPRPLSERERGRDGASTGMARSSSPASSPPSASPSRRPSRAGHSPRSGRSRAPSRARRHRAPARPSPAGAAEAAPRAAPAAGRGPEPERRADGARPGRRSPATVAAAARPADPAVRAVAVGLAHRRRRDVPRRRRPRDVLWRPDRGGPRRHRPRRRPQVRPAHGLGRRPQAVPRPARQEALWSHPADRRRHRRRQRLPQHLCPLRQGRGQEGRRSSRPASFSATRAPTGRASGCHLHYGLFSPLETATFGHRAGRRQADEAARPPDRADRPDARPRPERPEAAPSRDSPTRARPGRQPAPVRAGRLSAAGSAGR